MEKLISSKEITSYMGQTLGYLSFGFIVNVLYMTFSPVDVPVHLAVTFLTFAVIVKTIKLRTDMYVKVTRDANRLINRSLRNRAYILNGDYGFPRRDVTLISFPERERLNELEIEQRVMNDYHSSVVLQSNLKQLRQGNKIIFISLAVQVVLFVVYILKSINWLITSI